MLESLITGEIPTHLQVKIPLEPNWGILKYLWSLQGKGEVEFFEKDYCWNILEKIDGNISFHMLRNRVTNQRNTVVDSYGLLGLSTIDLSQKSVILTEGVSDFFTAKLLCPNRNVLGVTTLGGSRNARALLVNLFDTFTICTDNDETGLKNAANWKSFLQDFGKQVNIFAPPLGKDITDAFIFNIKLNQ